jgi:hypothetical protein
MYEIVLKGNTRTRIPVMPNNTPNIHPHSGTCANVSRTVHAGSGIESAESMIVFQSSRLSYLGRLCSSAIGGPKERPDDKTRKMALSVMSTAFTCEWLVMSWHWSCPTPPLRLQPATFLRVHPTGAHQLHPREDIHIYYALSGRQQTEEPAPRRYIYLAIEAPGVVKLESSHFRPCRPLDLQPTAV